MTVEHHTTTTSGSSTSKAAKSPRHSLSAVHTERVDRPVDSTLDNVHGHAHMQINAYVSMWILAVIVTK